MNNPLIKSQYIAASIGNMKLIHGIYRLIGCLLLLDKKQRPYWNSTKKK